MHTFSSKSFKGVLRFGSYHEYIKKNKTLLDDLQVEIKSGSKINITAACFSVYAFQQLKQELCQIDELRFIFNSPSFVSQQSQKEKREFFDKGVLKNEYDQAFLMAFIANKNFISSSQATTESNIINQMIQRLVENLLDTDPELTEDKIEDAFLKQIKIIKERNANRSKRIYNVLEDRLEREEKSLNEVLDLLRKEA